MKSRPILFSAPMVRALLAGRKTQTRRVVKGDVEDVDFPVWWGARRLVHSTRCQRAFCESVDDYELGCGGYDCAADGRTERSPHGAPGDQLWVRETWLRFECPGHQDRHVRCDCQDTALVRYAADCSEMLVAASRWRPSIFMPRWASRLTLELISVRVERLQDISEADAKAEGSEQIGITFQDCEDGPHIIPSLGGPYRDGYRVLWESINGPGSWAVNPWVWCLSFRRLP